MGWDIFPQSLAVQPSHRACLGPPEPIEKALFA